MLSASVGARGRSRINTSSHSGIGDAVEDGRRKNMSRSRNYPFSMTLRLTTPMQSEVENLAYDLRLSKAGFIRRCIRQAIVDAYDHRTPSKTFQIQGGAL